eukprot:TRINITY_DN4726_c0_g5_i1.p2 TRINITY_DN4726_c0_g5~~TRINITY_DN4726_c0_g5_i1.p2  ORF type:complete len:140 (-),score=37.72 TRINITY_DN4726_c0_g5_i1:161-580(-)
MLAWRDEHVSLNRRPAVAAWGQRCAPVLQQQLAHLYTAAAAVRNLRHHSARRCSTHLLQCDVPPLLAITAVHARCTFAPQQICSLLKRAAPLYDIAAVLSIAAANANGAPRLHTTADLILSALMHAASLLPLIDHVNTS